ncbi:hypothetical protein [Exiguobacterium undae]|uniref:Uncharacterized protein n=1 Tax=Exiguobacterium undae TaxID=169177 RepID=A0ABX2V7V8_9BACL|nr:hypothetical protein [Exiguobacterium undae]OAN13873.1 hypothetical protein A3783_16385 [Exiguobacterium undae]
MNMNELGLPNDTHEAAYMMVVENEESAKMYLELQMYNYSFPDTKVLLAKVEQRNVMSKKNLEMMPMVPEFQEVAASAEKELEKTKLALSYTGHFESESK